MSEQHYDIIGDVHGHADALRRLLITLGYAESQGAFRHDTRKVIFVGDFVDRGPRGDEQVRFPGRADGFQALQDKLAPAFKRFYRWPGTDPEFYESDTSMTLKEFQNSVEEYEQDDRDTERRPWSGCASTRGRNSRP
jgi:hypothetical protein